MQEKSPGALPGSNAAYDWNDFSSQWYKNHNYASLRRDDEVMLRAAVKWFAAEHRRQFPHGGLFRSGIDVGAGANMYAALAMLGFVEQVTLFEFSSNNIDYLNAQVVRLDESWAPFWGVIAPYVGNRTFAWAKDRLRNITRVVQGSIFKDLGASEHDMGTMCFVAESLTARRDEFEMANNGFLRTFEPEAPFFAAYMENSIGYRAGKHYPATPVNRNDVENVLAPSAARLKVQHIDIDPKPVHSGYTGYVVATGTAR